MSQTNRSSATGAYGILFDGRYLLAEGRWEGAVGVVREAYDTWADDRRVVIKHPDPYTGPQVRAYKEQLLASEAHVLGLLKDVPQVCKMLAQGRVGQGPGSYGYLVIEWAEGEPVAEMLQRAAAKGQVVPIGTALAILSQLAEVLAAAHEKGIINNDVDVKHLYWSDDTGILKVIDWGNAKTESSSDWGRFGFHDDLSQFAEAMFCLLTGRPALDARQADLDYWQNALRDVLAPVRADLGIIGSRLSARDKGYASAKELSRALKECAATFDHTIGVDLAAIDRLLAEAPPEALARAEEVLMRLRALAPAHAAVKERVTRLEEIRQERKEAAALQLGAAYVKAGSWLGAAKVLSQALGDGSRPESDPALLLAAVLLIDSRRDTISTEAQERWIEGARAIAEKRHEDALNAYLAARDEWFDTRVEPLRSLLARTGRYVLRHELRTLLTSLGRCNGAARQAANGASQPDTELGRATREFEEALAALDACPEQDWLLQHHCYARVVRALELFRGRVDLPLSLRGDVRAVAAKAQELVGCFEEVEQALQRHDFVGAADSMLRIPRLDPDSRTPLLHAGPVQQLAPIFDGLQCFQGWGPGITEGSLAQDILKQIDRAFAPIAASSLKARIAEVALASVRDVIAEHESQHLEDGLRLLRQRKWEDVRRWARSVLAEHPNWRNVGYAAKLAEAYIHIFEPAEPVFDAPLRASRVVKELEAFGCRDERLTLYGQRIAALAGCFQHLLGHDLGGEAAARAAIEALPADDPYRDEALRGIELMMAWRTAMRDQRWEQAQSAVEHLQVLDLPILPRLAARWRGILAQVTAALGHRRLWQYEEAVAALDSAMEQMPTRDLGSPAPTSEELRDHFVQLREIILQESTVGPRAATTRRSRDTVTMRHKAPLADGGEGASPLVSKVRSLGRSAQDNYARLSRMVRDKERPQQPQDTSVIDKLQDWFHSLGERFRRMTNKRPFEVKERKPTPYTEQQGAPLAVPVRSQRQPKPRARAARRAPNDDSAKPSGDLWESASWAVGGALMVGVLTIIFALSAAPKPIGDAVATPSASAWEQSIAQVTGLLQANEEDRAAELLAQLRTQGAALSAAQRETLDKLGDCVWLQQQHGRVDPVPRHEDLVRLGDLWLQAQGEDLATLQSLCSSELPIEETIRAEVGERWGQLQNLLAQDTVASYEAIIAALSGLEDAPLSVLCGGETVFRETLVKAHAGLARLHFEARQCELGSQGIGHILPLIENHQELAQLEALQPLNALQESCWRTAEDCQKIASLVEDAAPEHPGEDLRLLAELAPRWDKLREACQDVTLEQLVEARLAALQRMLDEGHAAQAGEEALKIQEHAWFTHPPGSGHSPAVVAVAAAALQVEAGCSRGECGVASQNALLSAQGLYQQYKADIPQDVQGRLVQLIDNARAACRTCQRPVAATATPTSSPAPTIAAVRQTLLDPDLGEWTDIGVYYGDTANGRVWYLYDRFVKRNVAPLIYQGTAGGRQYQLYNTLYRPEEGPFTQVTSVRTRTKVLSVKETIDGAKPLWGVRIAGVGERAVYLLVLWSPTDAEQTQGRWSLRLWSPDGTMGEERNLIAAPSSLTTEVQINRSPDGASCDIYWQGELVFAQQPLPAPAELNQVEFLVGEGVHIWLRDAQVEIVR